jgi:hypothetical protein
MEAFNTLRLWFFVRYFLATDYCYKYKIYQESLHGNEGTKNNEKAKD